MMTTDLALIGRLGDHVVAAAALAQIVLFVAFVLGMGIVSAVAPLAAQAYGARQPRMVRRALARRIMGRALSRHPAHRVQLYGEEILLALGQSREFVRRSRRAICSASPGA